MFKSSILIQSIIYFMVLLTIHLKPFLVQFYTHTQLHTKTFSLKFSKNCCSITCPILMSLTLACPEPYSKAGIKFINYFLH